MRLDRLGVNQARQGLREKKFSAVELVTDCLIQIKKNNARLNCFLTVNEQAVTEAKKADLELAKGKAKLLTGIPFSLKDVYCTKNLPTTAGAKLLENYLSPYNATVYQRLVEQGAVLMGKTNCDAWGHGSSTENSDYGPTKNPWNEEYVPGGSSGGSGADLAMGMSLFSIGEDTGGSIRMPASFCGVTGLKVTYGRVSRYGAIAYASSLDSVGPMARNAEDCAIILEVIAGPDGQDATLNPLLPPKYSANLDNKNSLTIGVPEEFFGRGLDQELKTSIMKALEVFERLGFKIVPISIRTFDDAVATYYLLAFSETSSNLSRYDGIRYGQPRTSFGPEAKRRIMMGTYALSAGYYDQYYLKALKVRTLIRQDFQKAFKKCDLVIAPVAPTPPFKLGEKTADPLQMYLSDVYVGMLNLAGVPGLAVPSGFTKGGLPLGFQLIAAQFNEEKILQAGYRYQQATDWHLKYPPEQL